MAAGKYSIDACVWQSQSPAASHGRLWYNVTLMPPTSVSIKNQPILIVFLENGGHVAGVDLPPWAARLLDWSTEEYGKLAVRLQARRHYRPIVVLEDQAATAAALWQALLAADDSIVDVLLLVHGQPGYACGCADHWVGADFFDGLRRLRVSRPGPLSSAGGLPDELLRRVARRGMALARRTGRQRCDGRQLAAGAEPERLSGQLVGRPDIW